MQAGQSLYRFLLAASWLLTAAIFAGDLAIPLGVAGGVLYAAVVLVAMALSRRLVYLFAAAATALTVVGFFVSPEPATLETLSNRAIGVFAIWVVALMGLRLRRLARDVMRQARIIGEVPDGVIVADRGGSILYYNRGARRIFGYDESELLGKPVASLFAEDQTEGLNPTFLEPMLAAGSFELNLRARKKSGEEFESRQWVMQRFEESGRPNGLIITVVEIPPAGPAEEAAERVESFYRDLLDRLPLQMALFDPNGRFLYLNASSLRGPVMRRWMLGRTERDFFERVGRNLHIADEREVQFRRAVEERRQVTFEEKISGRGGIENHFMHSFFPVVEADGEVSVVLGYRLDITERVRAEQALKESLARLRAVFDTAGDGIITLGEDGLIESANRVACHLLGFDPVEITKLHVDQILFPCVGTEDCRPVPSSILDDLPIQTTGDYEACARRKDGSTFQVELTAADVQLPDLCLTTIVLRDITARRQAEQALRRYNDRLEGLRAIDQAVLTAQSTEAVAEVAARHLLEMTSATAVAVGLLDDSDDALNILAVSGDGKVDRWTVPCEELVPSLDLLEEAVGPIGLASLSNESIATPLSVAGPGPQRVAIPLRAQKSLIGLLSLTDPDPNLADSAMEIALDVAALLAVALHQARLFEEVAASRLRLQSLSRRLVDVQEQERRRLARELHDEVGQTLTSLKLTLETLARRCLDGQAALLTEAAEIARRLLATIRDLSLDLRPAMLDDLGLVPALLWLLDRYERQTGIEVEFRHHIEGPKDAEVETAAYRIVQEALTNIARHAGADRASVLLAGAADRMIVTVIDRGIGFDLRAAMRDGSHGGLSGIQERVELLGGTLTIETAAHKGTHLTAVLPTTSTATAHD